MARRTASLVAESNFLLATRETGYRSTAAAVAELLDNSLEAGANQIQVWLFADEGMPQYPMTLAVLDNGIGMDGETLRNALRFGGSERFDSRSGQGRFGMGLPNSSVSQCRRVDVYTWQRGDRPLATFLDIDRVVGEGWHVIPKPRRRPLPEWAGDTAEESGTLVVWTRCDRFDSRRISTLVEKLQRDLGRIFRYALGAGVEIRINGSLVAPVDPLYLQSGALLSGAQAYGEPLTYWLRGRRDAETGASVRVRFSQLPVEAWTEWLAAQKRRCGISGGAGVSVVRAGREIAYGWYFMRGRRKQNYDDWWRCEVAFEPVLDEWFGVTHSKQGIRPTAELVELLSHDMVAIANDLNTRVRNSFQTIRAETDRPSLHAAARNDWRLPPVVGASPGDGALLPVMLVRGEETPRVQYRLRVVPMASREFFRWGMEGDTLCVEINEDHPFFQRVYASAEQAGPCIWRQHLESMLLALARTEAQRPICERELLNEMRSAWSDALLAFLR